MTYQVLARKWRPQDFSSLVGQEHVVTALRNALADGRIAQAYLFSGIRGVGKTTAARLLAKALNCEQGPTPEPCNRCTPCREITAGSDLDVLEVDAATYSKVEQVRELTESLRYGAARDRYKVVVLDEIHRLSRQAFDALLKIVEEPPPHLVFVFATTESEAVPATVLSRCQEFHFRRVASDVLARYLRTICEREEIETSDTALRMIARAGEGSVRDSVALLDQLATFGGGTIADEDAARLLGGLDAALLHDLLAALLAGDGTAVTAIATHLEDEGRDPRHVFSQFLSYCRDALHLALGATGTGAGRVDLPEEEAAALGELARAGGYENLLRLVQQLLAAEMMVRRSENGYLAAEIAWLRAAELPKLVRVEELLGRSGGGGGAGGGGGGGEPRSLAVPRRSAALGTSDAAAGAGSTSAAGRGDETSGGGDGPPGSRGNDGAEADRRGRAPAGGREGAGTGAEGAEAGGGAAGASDPAVRQPPEPRSEGNEAAGGRAPGGDASSGGPRDGGARPGRAAAARPRPSGAAGEHATEGRSTGKPAGRAAGTDSAGGEGPAAEPGARRRGRPPAEPFDDEPEHVRSQSGDPVFEGDDGFGSADPAEPGEPAGRGGAPAADRRATAEAASPDQSPDQTTSPVQAAAPAGALDPGHDSGAAPASGAGSLAAFLDEVRRAKQPLAVYLDHAELAFEDGGLVIRHDVSDESLRRRLENRANREILDQAVRRTWGSGARWSARATRLAAGGGNGHGEGASPEEEELAAAGDEAQPGPEILEHPTVQTVLELFGGTIATVEERDD